MTELKRGDVVQWIARARNAQTKVDEALLFQGQITEVRETEAMVAIIRPYPCKPSSVIMPLNRMEKVNDD
jgi:hypothetical protein